MSANLKDRTIVVAGGTGNVGGFIVDGLLERGAAVAVPSRSPAKIAELRTFLEVRRTPAELERLHAIEGDIGDEAQAPEITQRIEEEVGPPAGALASLGEFRAARSLLTASADDLRAVVDGYLVAHFKVAQALLPSVKRAGGSYVLVNGPLAFDIWPGSGSAFVSMATAGQHMLFRALAQEVDADAQVSELVTHAFIRNRETQGPSPIPGEAVGAFAAHLLSGDADSHGQSRHVRSWRDLAEAGIQRSDVTVHGAGEGNSVGGDASARGG